MVADATQEAVAASVASIQAELGCFENANFPTQGNARIVA